MDPTDNRGKNEHSVEIVAQDADGKPEPSLTVWRYLPFAEAEGKMKDLNKAFIVLNESEAQKQREREQTETLRGKTEDATLTDGNAVSTTSGQPGDEPEIDSPPSVSTSGGVAADMVSKGAGNGDANKANQQDGNNRGGLPRDFKMPPIGPKDGLAVKPIRDNNTP